VAEVVLETDARDDWYDRRQHPGENPAVVARRIVRNEKCASIEEKPACARPAANDAERVRSMAILGPRLRQIGGASFDVRQGRRRRIPGRHGIKAATTLMCLASPCDVDCGLCLLEQWLTIRWNEIPVKDRDIVVAGVALRPDKPGRGIDHEPFRRQEST